MHFDSTITLGTVLQIASMFVLAVALFNALSSRMTIFENSLTNHAVRLDKHEDSIYDLVKHLQRLIGQNEVRIDHEERRRHERP